MNSKVFIHKNFTVGEVSGNIFGGFIEHVGRAVYTGIYEPEHPDADAYGFRNDVKELLRALDIPVIRYPGGNFASCVDWKDTIGPLAERPVRADYAWKGLEPNHVGVDEFVRWCRLIGSEPVYTINLGTGTPKSAQELVEYCNFPGGTYWSDKRRKNGFEAPHGIKYWCLGNELDGRWQIGHKTAAEYGRIAHETARMMKKVDPSIVLCACGSSGRLLSTFGAWDAEIMEHLYDDVDYISIHQYFENTDGDLARFLAAPEILDRQIKDITACCDAVGAKLKSPKKVMVSLDEWNIWYREKSPVSPDEEWTCGARLLEEIYDMADVLVAGGALLGMIDNCDRLQMACVAQSVNVLAPIVTEPGGGVWKQSIYYPLLETSRFGRGQALRTRVESPGYEVVDGAFAGEVKYLRTAAVWRQEAQEVTFFAINRSPETMNTSAEFGGFDLDGIIDAREIHHPDLKAVNRAGKEEVFPVDISAERITLNGNILNVSLKPYSWNIFRLKLR